MITETEFKGIKRNHAAWDLLAHRFYQNLFLIQRIPFEYLLYLERKYVKILLNPTAISLLEESIYSLTEVIGFSEAQLSIAALYKSLFQTNKEYYYRNFLGGITDNQAKLLTIPLMQNLILKKNRLNILTAVRLPPQIHDLLSTNHFAEYICNNPIDWSIFNKLNLSQFYFFTKSDCSRLLCKWYCRFKRCSRITRLTSFRFNKYKYCHVTCGTCINNP